MTHVLLAVVCVLCLAFAFVLAAQVEFARQLEEIRRVANIGSQPLFLEVQHTEGPLPPELLPTPSALDRGRSHLFFVSSSCYTCEGIASLLLGALPPSVWLVVDATRSRQATRPLQALIDEAGDRVLRDDGALAEAVGVSATPSLVVIEDRVPTVGYVLSTAEQFRDLVPSVGPWQDVPELALAE
jgi:hypothetical protein